MKSRILYRPAQSSRAETAVFGGLGIVALLTVVLAVFATSDFVRGKDEVVAKLSGSSHGNLPGTRYISSGQWLADMKTLVAMARWVIEPDNALPNADMSRGHAPERPAVSTNSVGGVPKA
jgi:hypothetical protein